MKLAAAAPYGRGSSERLPAPGGRSRSCRCQDATTGRPTPSRMPLARLAGLVAWMPSWISLSHRAATRSDLGAATRPQPVSSEPAMRQARGSPRRRCVTKGRASYVERRMIDFLTSTELASRGRRPRRQCAQPSARRSFSASRVMRLAHHARPVDRASSSLRSARAVEYSGPTARRQDVRLTVMFRGLRAPEPPTRFRPALEATRGPRRSRMTLARRRAHARGSPHALSALDRSLASLVRIVLTAAELR